MNIIDVEEIQDGAYPIWRAGFEFRQGSGNPPWGPWLLHREGTSPSLHGYRETARAARWLTSPRWPGETLAEASYWMLMRILDLPGRHHDPFLLPWEVLALQDLLMNEGHWGERVLLEWEESMPLEGFDIVGEGYEYTAGGRLGWLSPPAITPCLDVSEARAMPPVERCPMAWPFGSEEGRPPWWAPARRRADFPPPTRGDLLAPVAIRAPGRILSPFLAQRHPLLRRPPGGRGLTFTYRRIPSPPFASLFRHTLTPPPPYASPSPLLGRPAGRRLSLTAPAPVLATSFPFPPLPATEPWTP